MKRILFMALVGFTLACGSMKTSGSADVPTSRDEPRYDTPAAPTQTATAPSGPITFGGTAPDGSSLGPEESPQLVHVQRTQWRTNSGVLYNIGVGGSADRIKADGTKGPEDFGTYQVPESNHWQVNITFRRSGTTYTLTLTDLCHAEVSTGETATRVHPAGC